MNYSELLQLAKGWGNFISGRIIIWRLHKKRPAWDLDYMMEIGFSKVFALPDISEISRTSMERELNKLTSQFLVGGEK